MIAAFCSPPARRAPADLDNFEVIIDAILSEASSLAVADRLELAARIIWLGGYAQADEFGSTDARLQLAMRLAARITATI